MKMILLILMMIGIPDNGDNCPSISNPDQADANNNGVGDVCEDDTTLLILMMMAYQITAITVQVFQIQTKQMQTTME